MARFNTLLLDSAPGAKIKGHGLLTNYNKKEVSCRASLSYPSIKRGLKGACSTLEKKALDFFLRY